LLFGNASQIEYDILSSILARYFPELYASLPIYRPVRNAHTVPPDERPMALTHREPRGVIPLVPESRAQAWPLPSDAAERMRGFFARFAEVPGLPAIGGGHSNNWAVDGRHTIDGSPMIAGDPHQGFSSPNIFWLHHMHSATAEDGLDVIGWSFLGAPAIQLGHNRHIAWTATTTYPDYMDLWSVRGDEDSIQIGGVEAPIVRRTETILVRGGAPVDVEIESVPGYGVILPRDLAPLPIIGVGERVLLGWIGFAPTHEAQGFAGYDLATSTEDFETAARQMEIGAFNFVAADRDGITYVSPPSVPVRRGPITPERTPWTILDGDDEGSLWSDVLLTPEQLPHSRGGVRGFLATANNEPYGFNDDGDWYDGPFYFGMYFDPGTRAQRIEDELTRLTTRGNVTLEDMQTLQDDTHSILADDIVPPLLTAWDARAVDSTIADFRDRADLGTLVEALRSWDRRMERDAAAPVIFQAYSYVLTRRMASDEFSALYDPILEAEPNYLLKMTSLLLRDEVAGADAFFDEGRSRTMMLALADVAAWLTTRFGGVEPARYTWGALHGSVFGSVYGPAFETAWVPTDGADGTVNVSSARIMDGANLRDRIDTGGGSVYRMVAHFRPDGTPEAFFQMPRGVSGEPGDPFYENLHADWVEGRYRALRFEREDVDDGAAETFTIDP
jgi:penicillin amidase